jgi:probable HAF family extracellular repeat protein
MQLNASSVARRFWIPVFVLASAPGDVALAQSFTVHELDLGGFQTVVQAISDGRAAGWGTWPPDVPPEEQTEIHAFTWTAAEGIVDLGTLGGTRSQAVAVDGDRVVGFSRLEGDAVTHAFSWTPEEGLRDLGTLGGNFSSASGVSGDEVVGQSRTASGETHAFRWTPDGGMVDLGTLEDAPDSAARRVDEGLVAGSSTFVEARHRRPVAWTGAGDIIDITANVDGEVFGLARDVRDGVVVGDFSTPDDPRRAFAWTASLGRTDLPIPDEFDESTGNATSEGQVVGALIGDLGSPFGDEARPFSWTREGGIVEIPTLGGSAEATHVNAGRVLGLFHADPDRSPDADFGNVRTFLWTGDDDPLDVTPAGFFGARPAGIDAEGRIAVHEDSDIAEGADTRSAVLVPGPPDADGDGIPDRDDDCPESDLSATVVIDGCDSGVPNRLLPGGCTIADRIEECAGSAPNHRRFVKCVGRILVELKRARLITGPQSKTIYRCARRSSIP